MAYKLHERGLAKIFGISGSGPSFKLLTALRELGVDYIPVSHEAIGPIAAGVYQYMTGKLCASISIKGPGFANALAGVSAAWFERYPMLNIAEGYADNAPANLMHKRIDQLQMVLPVTDRISSLSHLDDFDDFLSFADTNSAPHHFELAEISDLPNAVKLDHSDVAGESELVLLGTKIATSEKPVLILGSLIHRLAIEKDFDRLQLPIFTTVQAKGILDESKLNAAGIYTGIGGALVPEARLLQEADLVLTIGLRNHEILSIGGKENFINLDTDFFPESPNTMLIKAKAIRFILATLERKSNWAERILKEIWVGFDSYIEESGWMPGAAFKVLNEQGYSHGMVLDTGTFCTIGEHIWRASTGRKFVGSSNGRNMGIGIPSALGLSLAFPDLPIFCVLGDGGIRYYNTEVRTFVKRKLPVCFILMTDDCFGSIAQAVDDFRYIGDILKPTNRMWKSSFEAMGVPSFLIENTDDLRKQLNAWDRASPMFLELPFQPEAYRTIAENLR
jgi:acetolactate synthase-1/2/3 large subunit